MSLFPAATQTQISRGWLLVAVPAGLAVLLLNRLAWRAHVRSLRAARRLGTRTVVVGTAAGVAGLRQVLARDSSSGLDVVAEVVLDDLDDAPLLFVSAGIGCTPVLGMLDHLARTEPDRVVTVLHFERTPERHAHRVELEALVASMPNATLRVSYTQGSLSALSALAEASIDGPGVYLDPIDLARVDLTANTPGFDPAVTSSTGDFWSVVTDPTADTGTPVTIAPGSTAVVTVRIKPTAPVGTVVSGVLNVYTPPAFLAQLNTTGDVLARVLRFPYEIPLSVVVGIVGAALFLWLLLRRRGRDH